MSEEFYDLSTLMEQRERILRELEDQDPTQPPPPPPPIPELSMHPPAKQPRHVVLPFADIVQTSRSRSPTDTAQSPLREVPNQDSVPPPPPVPELSVPLHSPPAKRPRLAGCPFAHIVQTSRNPSPGYAESSHSLEQQKSDSDSNKERNTEKIVLPSDNGRTAFSRDSFDESSSDEEDVDDLLEKTLVESLNDKKQEQPEIKTKRVLEHRGCDHFDVLPEGWVEVSHESGLTVYLHRSTRVCSFSRPYFLGTGSVRHHKVPETAITCLFQRKVRERIEKREKEIDEIIKSHKDSESSAALIAKLQAPEIKTAEDFEKSQLLPDDLYEYAKGVFKFKTINIHRDKSWASHRNRIKEKKRAEAELNAVASVSASNADSSRPALPSDVKLITIPALDQSGKPRKKGFMMNPQGKTSVSVLHEYVQKVIKSTIRYHYEETRSSSNPYVAIAFLKLGQIGGKLTAGVSVKEKIMLLHEQQRRDGIQHSSENGGEVFLGQGSGNSKKLAKLRAAIQAVSVLIPGIEFDSEGMVVSSKKETQGSDVNSIDDVVALFNEYPIEHERIPDLCARAGQPAPFLILQECLKRYAASGNTDIQTSRNRIKHHTHEYVMKVGKHEVVAVCTNKQEGKQMASQKMLKLLHPEFKTWGEVIRVYGYEAQRQLKDARKKGNEVTKLQGAAADSKSTVRPNAAILQRLKEEMLTVAQRLAPPETPVLRSYLAISHMSTTCAIATESENYSNLCPETDTPCINL